MSSFASVNQLEASMSYIEKTARKLYPIMLELKKRMIPEKKAKNTEEAEDELLIDLALETPVGVTKY
jgi:hypothetical protein